MVLAGIRWPPPAKFFHFPHKTLSSLLLLTETRCEQHLPSQPTQGIFIHLCSWSKGLTQTMDFSYEYDNNGVISPFLQSPAVDPFYFDADDDDDAADDDNSVLSHYGHGDAVLFAGDATSMVPQTIEPSQLADLFSSPSPSPTPFSHPSSPASSAT